LNNYIKLTHFADVDSTELFPTSETLHTRKVKRCDWRDYVVKRLSCEAAFTLEWKCRDREGWKTVLICTEVWLWLLVISDDLFLI